MRLEELAAKKVNEFAFMMQPLKIQGGTGSTVAPIAIRCLPAGPATLLARLDRRGAGLEQISHHSSVDHARRHAGGRRNHDPPRWPHRLSVPVHSSGRAHGARPPPLFVSAPSTVRVRLTPAACLT
jgi:hypothetical protein